MKIKLIMFYTKKFQQQNIGEILKEARYRTGLSLKIISKHVHINHKYLEALEKNNWKKIPGEIYGKNFLKEYCNFLKIPVPEIKFPLLTDEDIFSHKNNFTKKIKHLDLINLPKKIKFYLFVLAVFIFMCYIVWQINIITQPPTIEILYPKNDLITRENILTIAGKVNSEVKIKVNNEDVILSPENYFSQNINLTPGLNNIIIQGKTKYSKTRIIERKIIFEQN